MIKPIFLILLISHTSLSAQSFPKATDWSYKRIITTGSVCKKAYEPEWNIERETNSIMLGKYKVGTWEETGESVTIAFQGINSLLSSWVLNYFQSWGSTIEGQEGKVHGGILGIFNQINKEPSFQKAVEFNEVSSRNIEEALPRKNKEFIFTGYGVGGALAIAAAGTFESLNRTALQPNQVKIITFSAPKMVDESYRRSFINRVGRENILQFEHYTDVTQTLPFIYRHLGIPIYLLPTEKMRDAFYDKNRFTKNLHGTISILCLLCNVRELLCNVRDLPRDDKVLVALTNIPASLIALDAYLIGASPIIPSAQTLFMSFMDTKHNVEDIRAEAQVGSIIGSIDDAGSAANLFAWARRDPLLRWLYSWF